MRVIFQIVFNTLPSLFPRGCESLSTHPITDLPKQDVFNQIRTSSMNKVYMLQVHKTGNRTRPPIGVLPHGRACQTLGDDSTLRIIASAVGGSLEQPMPGNIGIDRIPPHQGKRIFMPKYPFFLDKTQVISGSINNFMVFSRFSFRSLANKHDNNRISKWPKRTEKCSADV